MACGGFFECRIGSRGIVEQFQEMVARTIREGRSRLFDEGKFIQGDNLGAADPNFSLADLFNNHCNRITFYQEAFSG